MPYAETQTACEALRAEFTARYRKLAPKPWSGWPMIGNG